MLTSEKRQKHERRVLRIRSKVRGTAERPRLTVHKTLKHIYVQLVDDVAGRTLAASTTNMKSVKGEKKSFANIANGKALGRQIAEKASAAGLTQAVFDRGGYPYHGIVKAIAESAREAGLKF
jgi:large subunit ribosomal protein L18